MTTLEELGCRLIKAADNLFDINGVKAVAEELNEWIEEYKNPFNRFGIKPELESAHVEVDRLYIYYPDVLTMPDDYGTWEQTAFIPEVVFYMKEDNLLVDCSGCIIRAKGTPINEFISKVSHNWYYEIKQWLEDCISEAKDYFGI